MTNKTCKKRHTPIVSEKQRGLFGAEYARRKAGEESRMSGITKAELKSHLKESKGKELPSKVSPQAKFEKMRMKQGAKHH